MPTVMTILYLCQTGTGYVQLGQTKPSLWDHSFDSCNVPGSCRVNQ